MADLFCHFLSLSFTFIDKYYIIGINKETYMAGRSNGAEEKAKLERLINEGSTVLREIEDLSEGLKETVKAVAEELQVKPSVINKAIKIAHKGDWSQYNEDWEEIEAILDITKRI